MTVPILLTAVSSRQLNTAQSTLALRQRWRYQSLTGSVAMSPESLQWNPEAQRAAPMGLCLAKF
ncbi:hypothetical protein PGTUg99_029922 [Puccinia graminis f. sp. tritici]|nr:hypothetical protein PGTUg99_029922 [Puccinia graminis f. sp. tritici]